MKWVFAAIGAFIVALGGVVWIWWFSTGSSHIVSDQDTFRFTVFNEPHSLDPLKETSTTARYLLPNLHRGLMLYSEGSLQLVGATSCQWISELIFVCNLNPDFRFSTGEVVQAADYIRTFQALLDPENSHPLAELLFPLQGARQILTGEASWADLGAVAKDSFTLEFYLEAPMGEFPYNLAHPALAPRPQGNSEIYSTSKAETAPLTGPYQVAEWISGKKAQLVPNPYYLWPSEERPPAVEVLFVEDDATTQRLYQQGRIDWLRRLNTQLIPNHLEDPAFRQVPVARFDYVGFGPALKEFPLLRKALAHALEYEELAQIYHALGRPGCPSLPRTYMAELPCYNFDAELARSYYQRHLAEEGPQPPLELAFSKLGGADVEKGMVWMAEQWRKHLGLQVSLEPLEQGQMLHRLWQNPPALFRKGVSLERPTCAAGLEIFLPQGSERFLRFEPPEQFQELLTQLTESTLMDEKQNLCTEAVRLLLSTYSLIPLGEIHFSMLVSPQFTGVDVNELNQLDLTRLQKVAP